MKLSTRLTGAMVGLVLLTAAAVGLIVHYTIQQRALPGVLDRIDTRAHLLAMELDAAVRPTRADVNAQGRAITALATAAMAVGVHPIDGLPASQWRELLASRFVAELAAKPNYSQFRLIGAADGGREIVRVDRMGPGGQIRVVSDAELQHKGDPDYLEAALRLRPDEVYGSPIDFNQEGGVFETPYVPTLRLAAPVFAQEGQRFGILIINIDLRSAFARIRNAGREGAVYVVNERGDYLVHPNPDREFGFELGRPFRVQDEFPEFAGLVGRDATTPRIVRDRAGEAFGIGWDTIRLADGPKITVLQIVPYARLFGVGAAGPSLIGALLAALGALPLAVILARSLSRPLVQVTDAVEAFSRNEPIAVPIHAGGEIGVLARAFARMADEVRERTSSLTREIDERRLAEEKFRLAVEASPNGLVMIDAAGKIVLINTEIVQMFGYEREELIGGSIDMLVPLVSGSRHAPDGMGARPQTPPMGAGHEFFGVRKDGSEFPIEIDLNPINSQKGRLILGVIIDVSERKNAKEALLESERLARGIVAYSLDAIIQVNASGEVIEWNPQAEAMFGWSRQEAIGQPISKLYLPKGYRPRYLAMNERLQQTDGFIGERFDFEALRKDGQKIKVEVSMTGVRRRDGNVFNLFLRDITQKLAAEEQLRQSQKMEAIGQLTGGIAHDFNNMLTVITGTIELLAEAVADKPQLASIARLISEAADRGAELTAYLLAFARKQPLQPHETDIQTLVVEAVKWLRPALGEHIEIAVNADEGAWPALVDSTQLTTALLNLVVNARDAMPGGGKLTLEAKNVVVDQACADSIRDIEPGDYVMIAVSDTGHGIPAAIRDRVFEPFFSTKEPGKGTGLGLSMVYGFVKQSGGHIKIYSEESEEEHGTTIRIYLPRATAHGGRIDPVEPIESTAMTAGGNETILLVEDDPMVRVSVTTQLQDLGYRTISTANAAEALAIVDSGTPIDLLFTDVVMPGPMNGPRLAEELASRRPQTPVLFTSGYAENALVHHGRLEPGVLVLAKPYRKSELARMLRVALDRRAGAGGQTLKSQPKREQSNAALTKVG